MNMHSKTKNQKKSPFYFGAVELKKAQHLKIMLIPLGFLAVLFLWAAFSYTNASDYDKAQGYANLFYELPLINCVILPIMLAVLSSRLCDMEIKGQTQKLLYTLQEKGSFYDWKFLHEAFYLLLFGCGEGLIFPLCGKLFGFTEPLSFGLLCRHVGITLLVGAVVLTLQHLLSLCSQNQILPLIVGLIGSFLGLFSMFFPPAFARLVLWGYFGAFPAYGMNYDAAARLCSFYEVPFPTGLFLLFTLFGILFYLVCRHIFLKKEV